MSDDQNYAQQVKRASAQSETRFGFPSPEELATDRLSARATMRQTTQFRWAMFITSLQRYRRAAEKAVRDGTAASPTQAFWYQSDIATTTFMYLTFYTLSGKTRVRSDLESDLAVSKPFLRRFTADGIAGGFFDKNYVLSPASVELFISRVDGILDMPELRDLADSLHTLNVAESKAPRIT